MHRLENLLARKSQPAEQRCGGPGPEIMSHPRMTPPTATAQAQPSDKIAQAQFVEGKRTGQEKSASQLRRDEVASKQSALGPKHPDTILSMHRLALLLHDEGKQEEAEEALKDVYLLQGEVGEELTSQGKYVEAEEMYRQAKTLNETRLGRQNQYAISSTSRLADIFRMQEKYAEAEDMYRLVLEFIGEELGWDHPLTSATMNDLGITFMVQGKKEDAREMFRLALERKMDALDISIDHPEVYVPKYNLRGLLSTNEAIMVSRVRQNGGKYKTYVKIRQL